MRKGHENRVNLYDKAKGWYQRHAQEGRSENMVMDAALASSVASLPTYIASHSLPGTGVAGGLAALGATGLSYALNKKK